MALARPLRGIIPPVITPLATPDRLDVAATERLVEHMLAGGLHGLFLLGTNGEGPAMPYELRRELVERVTKQVAGRVPVLVGITDTVYVEAVRMAEFSAKVGADAVVFATPYYWLTSQSDLMRYIAGLAKDSSLPVLLYNMPRMTKVSFAPETVRAAADIPNVNGVKDSCGDIEYMKKTLALLKDRPDFTYLVGPQELFVEGMKLGLHGGVFGCANLLPKLYVVLYDACAAKDWVKAEAIYADAQVFFDTLVEMKDMEYRNVRGLKSGLNVMGLIQDVLAWPYEPAGPELRGKIEAYFKSDAAATWL